MDKIYSVDDEGLQFALHTIKQKIDEYLKNYVSSDKFDETLLLKADINSPEFKGTPTVPEISINNNGKTIANTAFVWAVITDALSDFVKFDIKIVQSLPEEGEYGTFYFVPNEGSEQNNFYDEYVWLNNKWEKLGTTEIDLSGYVKENQLVPISDSKIDEMFAGW